MSSTEHRQSARPRRPGYLAVAGVAGLVSILSACGDALNPAFLDVLGAGVVSPRGPTSAGHVVVALRNDAIFDERVLQNLVSAGLDSVLLDDPALRPRMRMLLLITFVNGNTMQVQFDDGAANIVHPESDQTIVADLSRPQQNNVVVQCDVARVELVSLPEVFVPDFFETTRIDPGDENTPPFPVRVAVTPPNYQRLQLDTVDQFGTITTLRNIDIRDAPAPAVGPNCGSVVTILFSGTLSLPFQVNSAGSDVPGALVTNLAAINASPGRFQINVGIR